MEENNKIIAEFMGIQPIEAISDNTSKTYYYYNNSEMEDYEALPEYHSDWNWLMEVVEKIENTKIKDYSISTDITDDKTFINVWHYGDGGKWSILISNLNEEYKDFNKMQRTYKAVVKFINFYNKQKEE